MLENKDQLAVLRIAGERIDVCVKAFGPAGLFYGIQSLRQLLPPAIVGTRVQSEQPWHIPACTTKDKPRFAWRAFLLDEARHFKGMAVVKQLLDQMATLKMNVFHWHLTDDLFYQSHVVDYPKQAAPYDGLE